MKLAPAVHSTRAFFVAFLLGVFLPVCGVGASAPEAAARSAPALSNACAGCHGENGGGGGSIPSLRNKSGAELMILLREFRTGKRKGTVMNRIVQGYDDSELAGWAHWFGQDSR